MRRVLWLVSVLLVIWFTAACGAGAAPANKTTDTRSATLKTDAEKIAFLQQYLKLPSEIMATEFHIVYHDNAQGLPGPSDYDIRAALKVAPEAVARWSDGLQPVDAATTDLTWTTDLLPPQPRWAHASPPQVYMRPGAQVVVVVYAPEGIVLKRVWTQ